MGTRLNVTRDNKRWMKNLQSSETELKGAMAGGRTNATSGRPAGEKAEAGEEEVVRKKKHQCLRGKKHIEGPEVWHSEVK